ncbi:MAG: glycosyltransferase [Deltaproteobacteria bacterium]|nr:glycosyltransferase [Deltaproteobacteria bacterium]
MPDNTILYVIGSLDLGGAERHIATIAPRLKELGWRPTVYCLSSRGVQAGELDRSGVRVIGPPWDNRKTRTSFGRFVRLLASSAKLLTLLISSRPPIVHFFLPAAYILGAPLAIIARVPIRLMSRRSLNRYQKNYPVLRRIERLLHSRMQILLGNSQAVINELRAETNGKTPIELIYNGVNLEKRPQPLGPIDNVPAIRNPDELVLIIVANLVRYKGHSDLFHALAMHAEKLPRSWTLLCVGRDDGLAANLQELAQTLQIDRHIQLLGPRTDVAPLLASADIGILCSHEEGFSNAILEGMAAGLPMVVTDVGGNAEAVVDRESGIVVPAHDPKSLGAAILELASDPDLMKRMGAAGSRRVETLFSLEQCVRRYDDLYRRLVRSRAGNLG